MSAVKRVRLSVNDKWRVSVGLADAKQLLAQRKQEEADRVERANERKAAWEASRPAREEKYRLENEAREAARKERDRVRQEALDLLPDCEECDGVGGRSVMLPCECCDEWVACEECNGTGKEGGQNVE
jgi:hypothetical protein